MHVYVLYAKWTYCKRHLKKFQTKRPVSSLTTFTADSWDEWSCFKLWAPSVHYRVQIDCIQGWKCRSEFSLLSWCLVQTDQLVCIHWIFPLGVNSPVLCILYPRPKLSTYIYQAWKLTYCHENYRAHSTLSGKETSFYLLGTSNIFSVSSKSRILFSFCTASFIESSGALGLEMLLYYTKLNSKTAHRHLWDIQNV